MKVRELVAKLGKVDQESLHSGGMGRAVSAVLVGGARSIARAAACIPLIAAVIALWNRASTARHAIAARTEKKKNSDLVDRSIWPN
jgi:hypothetical protein